MIATESSSSIKWGQAMAHSWGKWTDNMQLIVRVKLKWQEKCAVGSNRSNMTSLHKCRRLQDPIIRNITSRAAQVTRVPVSYQEDLQVLRYSQNQEYQAHVDSHKQGGKDARESTFVLYLSGNKLVSKSCFHTKYLACWVHSHYVLP